MCGMVLGMNEIFYTVGTIAILIMFPVLLLVAIPLFVIIAMSRG